MCYSGTVGKVGVGVGGREGGDEVEGGRGGGRLVKVGGVDTEMYRTRALSCRLHKPHCVFCRCSCCSPRAERERGCRVRGGGPCQVRFHAEQRLRSSFRDRHRRMVSLRRAGRSLQGEE